jgi:hypothetical protein
MFCCFLRCVISPVFLTLRKHSYDLLLNHHRRKNQREIVKIETFSWRSMEVSAQVKVADYHNSMRVIILVTSRGAQRGGNKFSGLRPNFFFFSTESTPDGLLYRVLMSVCLVRF